MGIETRIRLKGKISEHEILNFIKQNFDKNATSKIEKHHYEDVKIKYDDFDQRIITSGFIYFIFNHAPRNIFYFHESVISCEYSKIIGKIETTALSTYYCDDSINILKQIVGHFGGWIMENDATDDDYYCIEKNIMPIKETKQQILKSNLDEKNNILYLFFKDTSNSYGGHLYNNLVVLRDIDTEEVVGITIFDFNKDKDIINNKKLNKWKVTKEVRERWLPVVKKFLDDIDSLTEEQIEKYQEDYIELILDDTDLNPYTLWRILEQLGYEEDGLDNNGWEQDFWIDLTKENSEKNLLTNQIKIESTGMTFSLSLKVFIK